MPNKTRSRKKLTARELRDLDIEIQFIEGVVRRDPKYAEAWQVLADDYTSRGRFAEGLEADEKLSHIRPQDPTVHYNLACSYSRTGQIDAAAAALERALALGYRDFKWLTRDPDLANLRKHPSYKSIRARIRSMQIKIA